MGYIKNYDQLASNDNRRFVLDLIEEAYRSIQPREVFKKHFSLTDNKLKIKNQTFNLADYKNVFIIGFGKGSALMCQIIEEKLGDKITTGFVNDVVEQKFSKLVASKGTHPLPSQENFNFTQKIIDAFSDLSENDLVIVTTCGGGSVLLEKPHTLTLEQMIDVNKKLLNSGATISEMNVIRKHLSLVKGGGLAKILYPATVVNLLFSDVPGNDLSVIASGPLVKDISALKDVDKVLQKYSLNISADFVETPKEAKYFEKVHNILMLSNHTALDAMEKKARASNKDVFVLTDRLQGDARALGKKLIDETPQEHVLLAGGESTIKITGKGKGGRNQALVAASLTYLRGQTVIASFGSDGWDFYHYAGAIANQDTLEKIANMKLDVKSFLSDDNSYGLWEKIGDGIDTGKMESNVSDLYIVYKP